MIASLEVGMIVCIPLSSNIIQKIGKKNSLLLGLGFDFISNFTLGSLDLLD